VSFTDQHSFISSPHNWTVMAAPVRTAFDEAKHEREEKTWLQSPYLSFNDWKG
jgi:hypothetical protein